VKLDFSDDALNELKRDEAVGGKPNLVAYLDGGGTWTLGFGHTHGVKKGDTCTEGQADTWLNEDVAVALASIDNHVTCELTQNEFDALVIWEFNTGGLILKNGKPSGVLQCLNKSDYEGACREMQRWDKVKDPATGQEVIDVGLQNRRAIEAKRFNTGFVISDNGRPTPIEPPSTATATAVGKLTVASAITTVGGLGAGAVDMMQPLIDAGQKVQGALTGLDGYFKYIMVAMLVVSVLFNVATLVHKNKELNGAA
jgi:lysozyme